MGQLGFQALTIWCGGDQTTQQLVLSNFIFPKVFRMGESTKLLRRTPSAEDFKCFCGHRNIIGLPSFTPHSESGLVGQASLRNITVTTQF